MKKRFLSTALCLTFLLSAALPLSGCGAAAVHAADLTADLSMEAPADGVSLTGETRDAAADFAVALFQSKRGEALVSPLSVLSAMAIAANGAKGETLAQMEAVFETNLASLNAYLHTLAAALPSEKGCKVSLANSVWLRDDPDLTVEPAFLEAAAGYYGADVYKAPFDSSTLNDVNSWVSKRTDGMIQRILSEIPEEALLYLINALSFDGKWETVYREDQVGRADFTTEAGDVRNTDFLYSAEGLYLEEQYATGFVKPYAGGRYAFAALLPREGISLADYIVSLTGTGLMETLAAAREERVQASIPKFQSSASLDLSDALKAMGMEDAFSPAADFSGMGSYGGNPLFISRVLHETRFDLDAQGTRAGAATAVEMDAGGGAVPADEKIVELNRPFVYLLIDMETHLPLFIGALTDL